MTNRPSDRLRHNGEEVRKKETIMDSSIPEDSDFNHGQVLITCHLCAKKVELYCKSCDVNLCQICAGQHLMLSLKEHTVIQYSQKYDSIPQPICPSHADRKCDVYCRKCDVPVCTKCISSNIHKEHDIKEMSIIFEEKKAIITQETQALENNTVPEYERIISKIEKKIADLPKENSNTKSVVKEQGEKLHDMLNIAVDKHLNRIDVIEKEDIAELERESSEFQNLLKEARETIMENNEIVTTAKIRIFDFRPNIEKPSKNAFQLEKPSVSFIPGEIESMFLLEIIGKLERGEERLISGTHTTLLDNPIISDAICIEPPYDLLRKVCCLKEKEFAWIQVLHYQSEVNNLRLIDKKGKVSEDITIHKHYSSSRDDIAFKNGILLYSSYSDKSVNIVRDDGTITQLIETKWHPCSICLISSGDLLVVTINNPDGLETAVHKAKVLKYQKKPSQATEFEHSEILLHLCNGILEKDPVLRLAENKNNDICITNSYNHEVVILMEDSAIRTNYTGTKVSNKKQFSPRDIATDSQGHIVVTDRNLQTFIDTIHILKIDGSFLLLIDNSALGTITDISIDGEDNIWMIEGKKGSRSLHI